MSKLSDNGRGVVCMVAATVFFAANDVFQKLAMVALPPFEALSLRGVLALLLGIPLLAVTGNIGSVARVFDRSVLRRNGFDMTAGLGYTVGLKYASLPNLAALSQLTPVAITVGAVWFLGAKIRRREIFFVCLAFIGALCVAQPGLSGFSPYALLGLWVALAVTGRDLTGRQVMGEIPGLVVAWGSGLALAVGGGVFALLFEDLVMPTPAEFMLVACAALCLTMGHWLLFISYRIAEIGVVAPFFYCITLWALVSGYCVFGFVPNEIAMVGIVLILVSGASVVRQHHAKS